MQLLLIREEDKTVIIKYEVEIEWCEDVGEDGEKVVWDYWEVEGVN